MPGGEVQVIPVPKPAVGVVIGKGGDMINQIQNVTATRVQFKPGRYLVDSSSVQITTQSLLG